MTNSLEELRQRMLRDENVQEMIRARAFEIYRMRGVQPGSAAHDWFQAESEVLAFLLAHHPEPETEKGVEQIGATPTAAVSSEATAPKKRTPRATSKVNAAKKAATKGTKPQKSVSKSKAPRSRKESKSEDEAT
jgi:hypothetical protein